jgi:hypothetical protein
MVRRRPWRLAEDGFPNGWVFFDRAAAFGMDLHASVRYFPGQICNVLNSITFHLG